MTHPAILSWLKAALYAAGYLAICTATAGLPWMAQEKLAFYFADGVALINAPGARNKAGLILMLLAAGIFLGGLLLAWFLHHSRRLSILFVLGAIPAVWVSPLVGLILLIVLSGGGFGMNVK